MGSLGHLCSQVTTGSIQYAPIKEGDTVPSW